MKEFTVTWRIENISYSWHNTGEPIVSPPFTAGPIEDSSWTLHLYPRGKLIGDYLSLFLKRGEDNGSENLSVNFEISCISAENLPLHSYTFPESDKSFTNNDAFGHPRFMSRLQVFGQRKSLYLPQDTLTLRCRMWKNEGDVCASGESFALTRLEIDGILSIDTFQPEIENRTTVNIRSILENKAVVSIEILHFENTIRIEINPCEVDTMKFSELKLRFRMNSDEQKVKTLCEHVSSWLGPPRPEIWRLPLACKALNTGNEISVENNVEILSEFAYSTGEETTRIENDNPYSSRLPVHVSKYISSVNPSGYVFDLRTISQDLWNLYEEQVLCDVELKTPTTSFFAHKFVLCARSPVFLAMLTGDMKEIRTGCIEIEDIVDDILGKFLCFLYTDTFEYLDWDAAIDLYYASDKYHVERLKIVCCWYLLENADVGNVCELLMLADRHHDSDFKSRVEDFILQNNEKIFSSPAWKQFVHEQPFLSAKTMLLRYDKEREKETAAEAYDIKLSILPNALDDFTYAYQLEIICDIVIKTTDATFHAIRCVLCASSHVLREKFMKDFKGKPINVFEITDLESDIVSRVLFFLRADSLGKVQWDTAIKLYHAADMYQIHRLKIECSCFLLENLETSNASDLLLLAHEHEDAVLKWVVQDYIILHDEEIFSSDEWADFSETNFHLANETMRSKYRRKNGISLSTSLHIDDEISICAALPSSKV